MARPQAPIDEESDRAATHPIEFLREHWPDEQNRATALEIVAFHHPTLVERIRSYYATFSTETVAKPKGAWSRPSGSGGSGSTGSSSSDGSSSGGSSSGGSGSTGSSSSGGSSGSSGSSAASAGDAAPAWSGSLRSTPAYETGLFRKPS